MTAAGRGAASHGASRLHYLRRVFAAYLGRGASQLTFWHDEPALEPRAFERPLGFYYMPFTQKARYPGPFDPDGAPLLDYHGRIGLQHNPIAIAQFGLGWVNRHLETGRPEDLQPARRAGDWLVANLTPNAQGVPVWHHQFDFEYFRLLAKPWYSGLAQGQGLSLLLRLHAATGEGRYLEAARAAFRSLTLPIDQGGVCFVDAKGRLWIEEYIVDPPTHILNGFMWGLWGVYDYWQATGSGAALDIWRRSLRTLRDVLWLFDDGRWSLYDLAPLPLANRASLFYHRLHVVQLDVTGRLSGDETFTRYARRWGGFLEQGWARWRAWLLKAIFKLIYY